MEKRKQLSMVWKVTIMMTLLLLIPVAALCAFYIQTFQRSLTKEAHNDMQSALLRMETNIDNSITQSVSILEEFVYRQELAYFLDENNELSAKEINYYVSSVQSELMNIKYTYAGKFNNIGIYSSNKQIPEEKASLFHFYLEDLKEKPYYSEVVDGKELIIYGKIRIRDMRSSTLKTNTLNIQDTGSLILPVYRKVVNLNTGELSGIVELDIEVAKLADKQALENEGNTIAKVLLTPEKTILFDTGKYGEELEETLSDIIVDKSGTNEFVYQDQKYLIRYDTCKTTGLLKAVIMPTEDMMQYVKDKIIQMIFITLVCLAILVMITYYIMNNMLKRLVVLDQMMGKVGQGEFKVEISENEKYEDEVSRITKTFNTMASRLEQVMDEKIEGEKTKKDAELRALQAQINPHFLYNTLENLRMQCEVDGYEAIGESLSVLGELFRYSMSWEGNEVPFEMEWKNLKGYLHIMGMRFEHLSCELTMVDGVEDVVVPKLILQPLVENSFNHGFRNKLPPWKIVVRVGQEADKLIIMIEDNGEGIEEERMIRLQECLAENKPFRSTEKQRPSIGVINVKQRIDMLCKAGSGLEIRQGEHGGISIKIQISIQGEKNV